MYTHNNIKIVIKTEYVYNVLWHNYQFNWNSFKKNLYTTMWQLM